MVRSARSLMVWYMYDQSSNVMPRVHPTTQDIASDVADCSLPYQFVFINTNGSDMALSHATATPASATTMLTPQVTIAARKTTPGDRPHRPHPVQSKTLAEQVRSGTAIDKIRPESKKLFMPGWTMVNADDNTKVVHSCKSRSNGREGQSMTELHPSAEGVDHRQRYAD
ncbi:hypothetical protein M409DRAFT_48584 [Zasmidium cellare ATCC 36951]|uniref:Uncharacterized protein n=1 Tax=Zasmidium cellare ATCC 36951 TaxID=1080233 RepID=A0A6A6D5E9_ZASCE|nr:uncharacterized protein M409DRAFT_48584 [Zasmidium cellare ATCC 36951]KAF2173638.1 hypothetical protein M409DRAFT_48584 [Zasmidium cellare ATCC 36951]